MAAITQKNHRLLVHGCKELFMSPPNGSSGLGVGWVDDNTILNCLCDVEDSQDHCAHHEDRSVGKDSPRTNATCNEWISGKHYFNTLDVPTTKAKTYFIWIPLGFLALRRN